MQAKVQDLESKAQLLLASQLGDDNIASNKGYVTIWAAMGLLKDNIASLWTT
jgi:hypothetical protein